MLKTSFWQAQFLALGAASIGTALALQVTELFDAPEESTIVVPAPVYEGTFYVMEAVPCELPNYSRECLQPLEPNVCYDVHDAADTLLKMYSPTPRVFNGSTP